MKTVIIFTSQKAISGRQGKYELPWDLKQIGSVSFLDGQLIIAYDQEECNNLRSIIDKIRKGSDVYILHHNCPRQLNETQIDEFKDEISKQGATFKWKIRRMSSDEEYRKIQEIDKFQNDRAKLQEIFAWYEKKFEYKLELALQFLHGCLVGEVDISKLEVEGFVISSEFRQKCDTLKELNGNCNPDQFIEVLSWIRDEVLKQVS